MKNCIAKNFFKCGLMGWGLECFWTGCRELWCGNARKMTCKTSIWMFPIYGMASMIKPIYCLIKKRGPILRGFLYTICIYSAEFFSGSFLKKKGCCPWDYSDSKYNINGVIRLDYFPVWFFVGLFYEHLLVPSKERH